MSRCRGRSVGLTPCLVNQHEVRNLLFQRGGRLLELRFNQAGSDLIVEAVESGSDLAAFFTIECAL